MSIPCVTNAPIKFSRLRIVDLKVYSRMVSYTLISTAPTHLGVDHHQLASLPRLGRHAMRIVKVARRWEPLEPRRPFPFTRGEQQTGSLVMVQILALLRSRDQPDLSVEAVDVPRRLVTAENAENAELLVDWRAVERGEGDGGG
jgi:hypothetical protein